MIPVTCTACHKKLAVQDTLAGKKVKCPGCGHILAVAAPAPVAAPAGGARESTLPSAPEPAGRPPGAADNSQTHAGASMFESNRNPAGEGGPDASLTHFLAPPQAGDELGRLGKYRILEVLGHGGMGVVYKAEDPTLKRAVAVKAMLPGMAASASAGKRFLREAQTMAALKHDHIVTIYQVDEERGVPFLAMEFLIGEPLDERMQREAKLPILEVLRLGREIADGLAAAHKSGLIHRDVKPANVWLEAPRGRVKILDFGLARPAEQESTLTQQGAIVGTPAYMAPEQARGDPVDARSDLFSLGVILYRLCSARPPFQGRDAISTLMAVATDEPPPPIQVNPELPAELSELVMALLQKDPARRPASAAVVVEVLQSLEAKLRREQESHDPTLMTLVRPALPRRKAAPTKRRRWMLVAGVTAVLLLGLLAAVVVLSLRTKQGTLEVTVSEPGVRVFIDGQEKVVLESTKSGRIELIPGEHRLTVKRGDEELYTEAFTLESGGAKIIDARWTPKPSGDGAWLKAVAAMPPVKQVQAVAAKLKERNPGFDGKVELKKVEGGMVTEIRFSAVDVVDISPVQALAGLRTLRCDSWGRKSQLSDLSPLKGMKLTELRYGNTKVSDLSPLKGMPLTHLECGWSPVFDLSPLKDMKLTWLDCQGTPVTDLSPLKGMPLTHLACRGPVSDLSPLKSLPLTSLIINESRVSDLSALKGLPLTSLGLWISQVSDLSPLKGMKLTDLAIIGSPVSDLSPLKGMPLTLLNCGGTKVSDLSPLNDMKLTELKCYDTPVSDLSPLKGMQLKVLECWKTKATDLSPLQGMPLKHLKCDFNPERDAEILRSIKTLERINDKPAAEFWKEVDGKASNKKP